MRRKSATESVRGCRTSSRREKTLIGNRSGDPPRVYGFDGIPPVWWEV